MIEFLLVIAWIMIVIGIAGRLIGLFGADKSLLIMRIVIACLIGAEVIRLSAEAMDLFLI